MSMGCLKKMRGREFLILCIIFVVALFFYGCSSKDTSIDNTVMPENEQPMDTSVIQTDTDDEVIDEPVVLEPVLIKLKSTLPDPKEVTVKVGQEVIWENTNGLVYTIIGDNQDKFKSPKIANGETFTHVYTVPGEYSYVPSPGKPGKVIVVE